MSRQQPPVEQVVEARERRQEKPLSQEVLKGESGFGQHPARLITSTRRAKHEFTPLALARATTVIHNDGMSCLCLTCSNAEALCPWRLFCMKEGTGTFPAAGLGSDPLEFLFLLASFQRSWEEHRTQ